MTETPAVEADEILDDIIPESEEPDMEESEEEITAEEEPVAVEEIPSEEMAAAGYYIVIGSSLPIYLFSPYLMVRSTMACVLVSIMQR